MIWWILFAFLLQLLNSTYEQVGNATLTKSSSQDHWPKGANYPSVGTSQPNGSNREHFNIYTISTWDKTPPTTDSRALQPFSHSDEDRNEEFTCSQLWFYPKKTTNGSVICECGSALGGRVLCTNETLLQVLDCYCMTYSENSAGYVVSLCYYGCCLSGTYYSIPSQLNATELNTFLCGDYHRDGQLCGKCKHGFAPSVYSYSLACVECSNYTMNWIKYIAVAFLPLTLFLGVIVVFRLGVTSGLFNGFVLITQFYSMPQQLRYLTSSTLASPAQVVGGKTLSSLYGCWNLDFFRMIYTPFCLHPKMTTIQALALDYVLAIYPLVQILPTSSSGLIQTWEQLNTVDWMDLAGLYCFLDRV